MQSAASTAPKTIPRDFVLLIIVRPHSTENTRLRLVRRFASSLCLVCRNSSSEAIHATPSLTVP
jgi:hypothetical protein